MMKMNLKQKMELTVTALTQGKALLDIMNRYELEAYRLYLDDLILQCEREWVGAPPKIQESKLIAIEAWRDDINEIERRLGIQ